MTKKLFAIFGDPISHSRSPLMHNSVFKYMNYHACYTRVHLKDGSKLKDTFLSLKLNGANVTVPYKEDAFRACDEIRGFAKKVKVVNTIVNENGKLIGYNTDADGFMYAINEFKNIKKILIIGAGGTAKALATKFIEEDIKISVLNRSKRRLENFKNLTNRCYTWDNFILEKYDLVINTTSAGLNDNSFPVPKEMLENILEHTNYVTDTIYGKITPFLKLAKEKNIMFKDGADMLLGQGILANELFVNYKFKKDDIKTYMKISFKL